MQAEDFIVVVVRFCSLKSLIKYPVSEGYKSMASAFKKPELGPDKACPFSWTDSRVWTTFTYTGF